VPPARAEGLIVPVRRIRILSVAMFGAAALLGLKLAHLGAGIGAIIGPAVAEAPVLDQGTMVAEARQFAAIEPGAGKPADETTGDAPAEAQEPVNDEEIGLADQPAFMSRSEIDLLQDLSNRRQELEARRQQLDTRERLLMATEKRIDKKIERLKSIEAEIKDLLRTHSEEEEAQLNSLVKVYEAMKPKDAARIFEKLDMDILISVIERMKERKVAPVLAEMDPDAAKALTIELATRKQLPSIDGQS